MRDKPWTYSYPAGIHWDAPIAQIYANTYLTRTALALPNNPALEFMGKIITYQELSNLVNQAAKGFQKLGVRPGVHVGLYLPNTPHYVISFFAILKAGGTVVNYSPLDAERVLEHKVEDSKTEIMVTLDLQQLYPRIREVQGKTHLRTLIVGSMAEFSAQPAAVTQQLAFQGMLVDVVDDASNIRFSDLVDNDGLVEAVKLEVPAEQVAVLQYTGGTTGTPKGAMLTHANLSAACEQYWLTVSGERRVLEVGKEKVLATLPMFHIYALTANMLFATYIGAHVVLHTKFEVAAAIKDLSEKSITIFPGVPTMFAAIANYPGIEQFKLNTLKFCGSGGAPLPIEVYEKFRRLTGCSLLEGWGMTETSPTGTFTPLHGKHKAGSCGIPVPGFELKFVDVSDPSVTVAFGQKGELCVRGPNVMKGYWNNPAATQASMTEDGYFRTGDVGYLDEDGYLYIVDRTKDMILCGGYNVYPRVIEEAIYEHPAVSEVSVIGIPDSYRGQTPKAFVALKPGADKLTLASLQSFLRERIGKHEMVQALEIREQLPKTAVGKLSKKELYEEEARRDAEALA